MRSTHKISIAEYIDGINSIYIEQPAYELGHDGSDGKCDCIGMCRGALKRKGVSDVTNMSGTNNAARKSIQNLSKIKNENQLRIGDVVLKTRDKDDKDYPLPDRYRKGHPDYYPEVGETNFTHIGTVTQINPLRITHMTSPTAKIDTKLGKWEYFGQLPWVTCDAPPEDPSIQKGIVFAESGKTVKMRAKPSTLCRTYWEVPVGSEVIVMEKGDSWSEIIWSGRTGYMMSKFLLFGETYMLVIPGLKYDQADELMKQYPGSYIEIERG